MADFDNLNPKEDGGEGVQPSGSVAENPVTLEQLTGSSDSSGAAPLAPALNKDGTIRKKPGRKPGQKNAPKTGDTQETSDTQAPAATVSPTAKTPQDRKAVRLGCDQTARAVLGTTVGALRELVGPEWDFSSQEEADGMRIALGAYIEAKGGGSMSPELALLLVTCGYAGPRFAHENTRSKFKSFFSTVLNALKGVFGR
jgi:hypothetical protein